MVSSSKEGLQLEEETIRLLEAYNWPGNVRELENCIERAVALCSLNTIQPNDLPEPLHQVAPTPENFGALSFKQARSKAAHKTEKRYLVFLMRKHAGNITRVAEEAEMTRRNTYRLLEKHNLQPDEWREA